MLEPRGAWDEFTAPGVWSRGGQGERAPTVSVPSGPGVGPLLRGHAPHGPLDSAARVIQALGVTGSVHRAGNPSGQWVPRVLMGRAHGAGACLQASPHRVSRTRVPGGALGSGAA